MLKLTKRQLMTMRLFQMFGTAVWFCFLKICINYFKHKNKIKKTLTVSMVVSHLYQNYYYSMSLKGVHSFIHFNIFIQDDHFSYSINCYQHGSCVHNTKDSHNTGNFTPYSFRIVFGFFNVPHIIKHGRYCETGPTVYSPYPRRLESLTIC